MKLRARKQSSVHLHMKEKHLASGSHKTLIIRIYRQICELQQEALSHHRHIQHVTTKVVWIFLKLMLHIISFVNDESDKSLNLPLRL